MLIVAGNRVHNCANRGSNGAFILRPDKYNINTNRRRFRMLDYVKMNDYSDHGDCGGRRWSRLEPIAITQLYPHKFALYLIYFDSSLTTPLKSLSNLCLWPLMPWKKVKMEKDWFAKINWMESTKNICLITVRFSSANIPFWESHLLRWVAPPPCWTDTNFLKTLNLTNRRKENLSFVDK